ncbi:DNA primase DnaG [Candidatus Halobonum tyrrellensis]|uniref:DNA primase DnaG n=1 Tax=Candidatus Halobonum tyrrellensis G22 TaxID=1324957 RepID=V4HCC8_9EURY|nr:DNA primase DnaG [Candidatus Halobonum tyrrellensis]ESP88325.1 DNA primase [Candidatus Halobonum tyrrellensis G22]
MDDTAKYLIHARLTADGVVERSDVVGAVFGQTEGLLGDELDLRDLQQSSKIGRIDVGVDSENGQSFGRITIASSLDKVETSILAASLEAITRVGPCEARVEVTDIEDMRAAQRREVVERAKELLSTSFDEPVMESTGILEEVREAHRVERIDEYDGLPAGPRVHDSDAVIVVEGRADVLTLLRYGIKNGVAVEGTNVPDAVADLTSERTVTAFLDGDRGGRLILRELAQVGDVDYVAFAPEGESVEDLSRSSLLAALREKAPFEAVDVDGSAAGADEASSGPVAATDGSTRPAPDAADPAGTDGPESTEAPDSPGSSGSSGSADAPTVGSPDRSDSAEPSAPPESTDPADDEAAPDAAVDAEAEGTDGDGEPATLRGHVRAVVESSTNRARVLDADYAVLAEVPAAGAFDALSAAEYDGSPVALVVDGELSQKLLDVAAQRGVEQVVAAREGEFVKRPTSVRVLTADRMLSA